MTWLIITYFLVLVFLSYKKDALKSTISLHLAWTWFTAVFFSQAFMTLFRAVNFNDLSYGLVEIWANGFTWFFLGLSLIQLPSLFLGEDQKLPKL